jgi:hypothetical protein
MAHTPPSFPSVRDRLLNEITESDLRADSVERLLELALHASPGERARMEHTINVIVRSREAIFQGKPNNWEAGARLASIPLT